MRFFRSHHINASDTLMRRCEAASGAHLPAVNAAPRRRSVSPERTRYIYVMASSLVFLLLLLNACSQAPLKQTVIVDDDAPLTTVTANPYLENRRVVATAANALFTKANQAIAASQWQQAETLLQQLIADYPDLSGPYLNLGIVYQQTGRLSDAEQQFTAAINVNASNLEAYNYLANLKRRQGRFSEAEKVYQQALQVWPDYPAGHLNLGILYDVYLHDLANAKIHYEHYQNLLPEPDGQVVGWLVDLERRMEASQP